MNEARNKMEDKYDEQTDHSKNKINQAQWEYFVSILLSTNCSLADALNNEPSAK
jgi:hypothetical protein